MPTVAKATSVKLDPETKARLDNLARARRSPRNRLVREAIDQYVEREEKRQAFYDDARQAWDDYEATGRCVSSEEADSWLAALEDGRDADPPACQP